MLKKITILTVLFAIVFSSVNFVYAQESKGSVFKARVIEVVEEAEKESENGDLFIQQNLKLEGLQGRFKNREFVVENISDLQVVDSNIYKVNDKVIVSYSAEGESEKYYIIEYQRQNKLLILFLIFAVLLIIIGRIKGLRALITLVLTFVIILYGILPLIIHGYNPILVAMVGGVVILALIIYLTEGFNRKSHIAVLSIFISLLVTAGLAILFTYITKLTGMVDEEAMFLTGMTVNPIDFRGLLLAGIIIGTLGVLDDVVISQIVIVEELRKTNSGLNLHKVFQSSFKVGISHISSMANTLFLAYAGASLPLLLLFILSKENFLSGFMVINNEAIATEIVRTLVGSIGLILAVPISTFLATLFSKETTTQKKLLK